MLKERDTKLEILDGKNYSESQFNESMGELARLNKLTNGYTSIREALITTSKLTHERPLRILEIGFGHGDVGRDLVRFAKNHRIEIRIDGVELNPLATKLATEISREENLLSQIRYETQNAYELKPEQPYHLIICNQMTHHLSDEELVKLLNWMSDQTQVAWFVSDLHRHGLPYFLFIPLTRFLGMNEIIQKDGKLSIARSFLKAEWIALLEEAKVDLKQIEIRWRWPFRYGLFFKKRKPIT